MSDLTTLCPQYRACKPCDRRWALIPRGTACNRRHPLQTQCRPSKAGTWHERCCGTSLRSTLHLNDTHTHTHTHTHTCQHNKTAHESIGRKNARVTKAGIGAVCAQRECVCVCMGAGGGGGGGEGAAQRTNNPLRVWSGARRAHRTLARGGAGRDLSCGTPPAGHAVTGEETRVARDTQQVGSRGTAMGARRNGHGGARGPGVCGCFQQQQKPTTTTTQRGRNRKNNTHLRH